VWRTRQWEGHLTSGRHHLQQQHRLRPGRHFNQGSGSSINGALLLLHSLRGQIQDPSLPSSSRDSSPGSRPMLGPSSMASVSPTASTTSPPLCMAETSVRSNLTGAKKSMQFLGLLRTLMALGVDPRPTPAHRFEVQERFTGLIADGVGQQALLVEHVQPVSRQLLVNQMFGLQIYQMLAAGVFVEFTLCREVESLFSS